MKQVYLDNAATTKVRDEVIAVMQDALANTFGNPSSSHSYGRTAKTGIESARKTIAKQLNAQPSEIIFTSGGTEADNMVLRSAVATLGVQIIITTKAEHHAVLYTVEELERLEKVEIKYVTLNEFGNPCIDHLEQLLQETNLCTLVSLMHINNETGNIIPIHEITTLVKSYGALMHSDTVQSIGHYTWDVQKTPIDFMAAAAHKFHGPKGIGFAFIRKNSGLGAFLFGGNQERGYRAGTESFHNILGLEKAFSMAYANLTTEQAGIESIKKYFIGKIKEAIPQVLFNGYSEVLDQSSYTILNVQLPILISKVPMLLFHLDMKGIACSRGSACQSGSTKDSHVLTAFLSEDAIKKASLRFSFSIYTTQEEIRYTVSVLKEFIAKLKTV